MWDVVGIVAACVVILLLLQVLDVVEVLKKRLRGESPGKSIEVRLSRLEERLDEMERMSGGG